MESASTKELFSAIQSKLIIDLKESEIICPTCKGLRFYLTEHGEKNFIEQCRSCHIGKLFVCKHCGKGNRTDYCDCKKAQEERDCAYLLKQAQENLVLYQKAEKINYLDYDGYFLLPISERLQEIDDVRGWIEDKLANGEDIPEYLWAIEGESHFSIDLKEVISDKCEDGYEDMLSNLDTKSPLLSQAQDLIKQWEKEQGESMCLFTETYKKAIIIKDLIAEIGAEMKEFSYK